MSYGNTYDNPFSVTYEFNTVDFGATSDTVLRIARPHKFPANSDIGNRGDLSGGSKDKTIFFAGGRVMGVYINGLVTETWADDGNGARIFVGTGTSATDKKDLFDSGALDLDEVTASLNKAYYFHNILDTNPRLERGVYAGDGTKHSGTNSDIIVTCQNCSDTGTEAGQAAVVGVIMQWFF